MPSLAARLVVLLALLDQANGARWPCTLSEHPKEDRANAYAKFGSFKGCGLRITANQRNKKRCLIIDDQKWCVCRHDLHLDKKYIKVGKVCMNAQKYLETNLDANELQAVTAQIPEDYQTEEMQQMHELVDELNDQGVGKWKPDQGKRVAVQVTEVVTGLAVLSNNALLIAGLCGALVPVIGVPIIAFLCVVAIGVAIYSHKLSSAEKAITKEFKTLLTSMQRIMVALDSVVGIVKKQNRLLEAIRFVSPNDEVVKKFLSATAFEDAKVSYKSKEGRQQLQHGFLTDKELKPVYERMMSSDKELKPVYEHVKSADSKCTAAISGKNRNIVEKYAPGKGSGLNMNWRDSLGDKATPREKIVCGTVKLLDSFNTMNIMYKNAVSSSLNAEALEKIDKDVNRITDKVQKRWGTCKKDAADCVKKKQHWDHVIHKMHQFNTVLKLVNVVAGVGAMAGAAGIAAEAEAVVDATHGAHGAHGAADAAHGAHGAADAAHGTADAVHTAAEAVADASGGAHGAADVAHGAGKAGDLFLNMKDSALQVSHSTHVAHTLADTVHLIVEPATIALAFVDEATAPEVEHGHGDHGNHAHHGAHGDGNHAHAQQKAQRKADRAKRQARREQRDRLNADNGGIAPQPNENTAPTLSKKAQRKAARAKALATMWE